MKFDHTKGAEPKYLVSVYGRITHDQHICGSYKDAKALFKYLRKTPWPTGTNLRVYDMKNDTYKDSANF